MLQWLRLSYSSERVALDVSYQTNDAESLSSVLLDPPCEILEGGRVKFQASQRQPRAEALLDDPSLPEDDVSSPPISEDAPSRVRILFRAKGQSAQLRLSYHHAR